MTEFLKSNITVSDFLKISLGILIPTVIYVTTLEKRITLLEYQYREISSELREIKKTQERLNETQIEILYRIEKIKAE
jgi:hypothetical protein